MQVGEYLSFEEKAILLKLPVKERVDLINKHRLSYSMFQAILQMKRRVSLRYYDFFLECFELVKGVIDEEYNSILSDKKIIKEISNVG